MKTITDKLLKENFDYHIESVGTQSKRLNGKVKKVNIYKLKPNSDKSCLWGKI